MHLVDHQPSLSLCKGLGSKDLPGIMNGRAVQQSALWLVVELRGLALLKIRYCNDKSAGWHIGLYEESPACLYAQLIYDDLYKSVFSSRREALQAVEGWLLAKPSIRKLVFR